MASTPGCKPLQILVFVCCLCIVFVRFLNCKQTMFVVSSLWQAPLVRNMEQVYVQTGDEASLEDSLIDRHSASVECDGSMAGQLAEGGLLVMLVWNHVLSNKSLNN